MVVDLTWEWRLADEGDDSSAPMLVPGDEISALEAGLISDLYSGCNEYDLRWICDRAWMISRSLVVDDPVLWWPAGSGAQVLHDLVLTHKAQEEHRKCGLRDACLIAEIDAAGLGFKFAINGRDIFARRANWIPADVLAGRIIPEKTRIASFCGGCQHEHDPRLGWRAV